MTTVHHVPHTYRADLTSVEVNRPLSELDAAIENVIATGSGTATTLTAQAGAGQASLTVASSAGFAVGDPIYIGTGTTFEARIVATVPGGGVTITVTVNLASTYAAGKPVSKSPVEIVDARGGLPTLGGRIGLIESREFDVRRYGALGGATDDTTAVQAAIDAASVAGGTVLFPLLCKVSVVTILSPNVSLLGSNGGGIQDGTVRIGSVTGDTVYMNMSVRGMKFVHEGESTTVNAIELVHAGSVTIDSCAIQNYDAGVYVVPTLGAIHVNGLIISNCRVGWGQFLLEVPAQPGGSGYYYSLADTTICNNMSMSRVANIRVFGADGIIIQGNTFFMSGAATENNIDITCGSGVLITANQCFESGLAGILLMSCQNFTISGNYLPWCGQREMNSAIVIDGGDIGGAAYNLGTITGNTMLFPSLHGITIYGVCGNIVITGNMIRSAGFNPFYYGTPAQNTVSHYGIMEAGTTTQMLVVGNLSTDNVLALDATGSHHANNLALDGVY